MNLGANTIIWTATSNNSLTCNQTVTIEDNEAPMITCPLDLTLDTDLNTCDRSSVMLGTAIAIDNCTMITPSSNAIATFELGINTVVWTANDGNGQSVTCNQTVTVEDNEAPILTCASDLTVDTDTGQCTATNVTFGTATATDNCAMITPTSNAPATFALGINTVVWTANDGNGQSVSCNQTVTVSGAALVICPVVSIICDQVPGFTPAAISVVTDCGGTGTLVGTITVPFTGCADGSMTVAYAGLDDCGNSYAETCIVNVTGAGAGLVTCPVVTIACDQVPGFTPAAISVVTDCGGTGTLVGTITVPFLSLIHI